MSDEFVLEDSLDETDAEWPLNLKEIPEHHTHAAIIDWRGSTKLLQNNFKAGANTISLQFQSILDEVSSLNRNPEVMLEVINFEGDGFKVCGNELGVRLLENFVGSLELDHLICASAKRTENWKYATQNGSNQLLCPELDKDVSEQKKIKANYKPFETAEIVSVSEMIKEEPTDSYSMTIEIPSFQKNDGKNAEWSIKETINIASEIERYIKLSTIDENVHVYWNVTDEHNIFFDVRFDTTTTSTDQMAIFDVIYNALNSRLIQRNSDLAIKPSVVIASGRTLVANHSYINNKGEKITLHNRLTEVGSGAKKQLVETSSLKSGISVLASPTNSIPLRYATSVEFVNNKPVVFIEGYREEIPNLIQSTLNIIGHFFNSNPTKFIQTVAQIQSMYDDIHGARSELAEALLAKLEHTFRFKNNTEEKTRIVDMGLRTVGQIKLNQVMDQLGEHGEIALELLYALSHLGNSLDVHRLVNRERITVSSPDELKQKLTHIRQSDKYITINYNQNHIHLGTIAEESGGRLLQQLTGIDNIKAIYNILHFLDRKGIVYFDTSSGNVILPDHTYNALFGDNPPPRTSLSDEIVDFWINQLNRSEQNVSMGTLEVLLKYDDLEDEIKQKFRFEYIKRGLFEKGSLITVGEDLQKLSESTNEEHRNFAIKLNQLFDIKFRFQNADTVQSVVNAFNDLPKVFDVFEHNNLEYIGSNINPIVLEQILKFMEEADSTGIPQITELSSEIRSKLKRSMIYTLHNKSDFISYNASTSGLHNIHYAFSNAELLAAYQEDPTDVVIIYENKNSGNPYITFSSLIEKPPYRQYKIDEFNDIQSINKFVQRTTYLSRPVAKRIYTAFNLVPLDQATHNLDEVLHTYYSINNKSNFGDLNSRYALNLVERLFQSGIVTDAEPKVYQLALDSITEADPHDIRNTSAAINNLITIAAVTGNQIKNDKGGTSKVFTNDGWNFFVTALLDQRNNHLWMKDKNGEQVFFDPYIGFNLLHTIIEFEFANSPEGRPNPILMTNIFNLIGREATRTLLKLTSTKEVSPQIQKQLTHTFWYFLELYEVAEKMGLDKKNNLDIFLNTMLPSRVIHGGKSRELFEKLLAKYKGKYEDPKEYEKIFRAVLPKVSSN